MGAMAEDSLEAMRKRREMERRARSRKRREQLIRDVCEEVGVEADEEVQRELLADVETMNMNFVNKREEGLNVIEKSNDNTNGKIVGGNKAVEKDKEDDVLKDEVEEILNGEGLSGVKLLDKLSKAAKKEKKSIAAEQQREMYYLIALFGMLAIAAAVIILEYIYRVTSPRYKNMWKHTDL